MRKVQAFIIAVLFIILAGNTLVAQTKDTSKFNVTADFMSRYIWRGLDYGKSPSIEPTLSFTKGGFEIGAWGSYSTSGSYYELDPYVKGISKNSTSLINQGIEVLLSCKLLIVNNLCLFVLL